MTHGFQLDPYTVLGVSRGVTQEELRDAYREKTKKHHPDRGGDEWAFRVVVRAYEILKATVPFAPVAPSPPPPRPTSSPPPKPSTSGHAPEPPEVGQARPGIEDKSVDPTRLVDVEVLWVRFEVEDFFELLAEDRENRDLSGCIQISWPDPALAGPAREIPGGDQILTTLNSVFDLMQAKTRVITARSGVEDGRFVGWLSYPSGSRAWKAFQTLHDTLKGRGLGVRQWTRDLIIPRDRG
jgi:curved DNA-binding protein CbpA